MWPGARYFPSPRPGPSGLTTGHRRRASPSDAGSSPIPGEQAAFAALMTTAKASARPPIQRDVEMGSATQPPRESAVALRTPRAQVPMPFGDSCATMLTAVTVASAGPPWQTSCLRSGACGGPVPARSTSPREQSSRCEFLEALDMSCGAITWRPMARAFLGGSRLHLVRARSTWDPERGPHVVLACALRPVSGRNERSSQHD